MYEPKAIHFIVVGLLVVISFMALLSALNPQESKPSEPLRIYFYDANGNPDGWGEVR